MTLLRYEWLPSFVGPHPSFLLLLVIYRQPHGGFPTHPHRDMEIISYAVQGGLTHQDSMGSKETLYRGSVQYMSAGTGVRHSEFNLSGTESLRLLQLWITPNQKGLKPNYGSRAYQPQDRLNKLLHLVSGDNKVLFFVLSFLLASFVHCVIFLQSSTYSPNLPLFLC